MKKFLTILSIIGAILMTNAQKFETKKTLPETVWSAPAKPFIYAFLLHSFSCLVNGFLEHIVDGVDDGVKTFIVNDVAGYICLYFRVDHSL